MDEKRVFPPDSDPAIAGDAIAGEATAGEAIAGEAAAIAALRRRADAGDIRALAELGDLLYWDEPQAARAAYQEAVDAGHLPALIGRLPQSSPRARAGAGEG